MLEDLFPYLLMLIFAVAFIIVVSFIFKKISRWQSNNHCEKVTVDATVVSLRSKIDYQNNGELYHPHDPSRYYVTFKFESGEKKEYQVTDSVYFSFIEGENGKLTYQGTRFISFE